MNIHKAMMFFNGLMIVFWITMLIKRTWDKDKK